MGVEGNGTYKKGTAAEWTTPKSLQIINVEKREPSYAFLAHLELFAKPFGRCFLAKEKMSA